MRACSWTAAPCSCRWGKQGIGMIVLFCLLLAGCGGSPPKINTSPPVIYSTAQPQPAPLGLYFAAVAPAPQDALLALNASDGGLRWTYQAAATVQPHPVVDQQVAYLGSADGRVYALDAASGSRRWSNQIGGFPIVAAVTDGGVYGSSPLAYDGSPFGLPPDGSIFALNARDGSSKWTTTTPGVVLAVIAGVVYVGDAGTRTLSALRASDGKVQWQFQANYPPAAMMVVAGQVYLLAASQDQDSNAASFVALNASTGAQQWAYAAQQTPDDLRLIGVDANMVYLLERTTASGSPSVSLVALDAQSGRVRWQAQASHDLTVPVGAVESGGVVYLGVANGRVEALSAADGSVRWRTPASEKTPVNVVLVADGMVYTEAGGLTALRVGDGSLAWSNQSDAFAQVLTERDGVLYAVSNDTIAGQPEDDTALALKAGDGTRLWQYDAGSAPIFPVVA